MDVILDQKLVMHAVVLRAPVLRQVSIPEVERRDRCPVPRLVDSQVLPQGCVRGVNRDHIEATAPVLVAGGFWRVDLQQDEHRRSSLLTAGRTWGHRTPRRRLAPSPLSRPRTL